MSSRNEARHTRSGNSLGFTLVEVLVILAIIAVLAGVLVPVVTNQIRKAEVGRVTTDLNALRTGVEAFVSDVKRYPGDIEDLSSALSTAADQDINGDSYPTGLADSWNGPYIDRVMADGGNLDTGFGGLIQDDLVTVEHTNGVDYLTIEVDDIGSNDFDEIDDAVDNGDGTTAGRLRFSDPTTQFLAIPIN